MCSWHYYSFLPRIEKGHGAAWGKRALSRAELHFEGTFARGIAFWGHFRARNSHKAEKNNNFIGAI